MLDLIHSDVYELIPTVSMNGYFLTFIDDCSRYCWVYFLKQNSEGFENFKIFKGLDKNTLEKKMKAQRYNNGSEDVKGEFQ